MAGLPGLAPTLALAGIVVALTATLLGSAGTPRGAARRPAPVAAPVVAPVVAAANAVEALANAADVRRIAGEAYVWGWPLAYVHQCRTALEKVPRIGRSEGMPFAPINQLAMLVDTVAGRSMLIPCPNQDVIYGFGVFDLADTPVVIQVPDFGDRVWMYQLGDQRTDSFADIGCMHGTRPGAYLVVGPRWSGPTPPGIAAVLRCPTRYAYCLPRVFFTAEPGDREAALPAVNRIMAYPLADFTGAMRTTDWARTKWLPAVAGRIRRGGGVTPEGFLRALPDLLADVPPLAGEEPLYARLRGLAAAVARDPALAAAALDALEEADAEIVAPLFHFRNVGRRLPGHWTTLDNGAAFGTDYLARTAAAKSNVFVNRSCETRYYYLDLDAAGARLAGDHAYVLTFPAGSLPPARGFWSLTVYDERHRLPDDAAGRHSVGSRDPALAFGPDGSLTIAVGPAGASADARGSVNRLSAPAGEFSLYLRIYWPDTSLIDAGWTPPAARIVPRPAAMARTDSRPPAARPAD